MNSRFFFGRVFKKSRVSGVCVFSFSLTYKFLSFPFRGSKKERKHRSLTRSVVFSVFNKILKQEKRIKEEFQKLWCTPLYRKMFRAESMSPVPKKSFCAESMSCTKRHGDYFSPSWQKRGLQCGGSAPQNRLYLY